MDEYVPVPPYVINRDVMIQADVKKESNYQRREKINCKLPGIFIDEKKTKNSIYH